MTWRTRWLATATAVKLLPTASCVTRSEPSYRTVTVGPLTYQVEVATTATKQRQGLEGRDTLPAGTGMLFQFGHRREQQVWMSGMNMPLDIAWIVDNKVLAIDTLAACDLPDQNQCPRWTSPAAVDALLEVPADSLKPVVPGMGVIVQL